MKQNSSRTAAGPRGVRTALGLLLAAAAGAGQTVDPVGLRALTSLELLPQLRTHTVARHVSSHDPTGGNDDGFSSVNFQYYDAARQEYVLLEESGPGCLYRLQMADLRSVFGPPVRLRIYLEGATTPQVDEELTRFFGGRRPPFVAPLVGATHGRSGFGYYCFVPIPYRRGVRVALTGLVPFYNISYHRYRPGIGTVPLFGRDGDLQAAARLFFRAGSRPTPVRPGEHTQTTTLTLPAGRAVPLVQLQGRGVLLALEFFPPTGTNAPSLDDLWLKIFWDGRGTPDVEAPFSLFFATGATPRKVPGLLAGSLAGRLYCYFPMPFFAAARVLVENRSGRTVSLPSRVTYRLGSTPYARGRAGYFEAAYRENRATRPGADYLVLDTGGSGHVVGVVLEMGVPDLVGFPTYLEGDDRIYVDFRRTPTHHGNGTEDFFGGAYYFLGETPALPLHGSPVHAAALQGDRRLAYRFFLADLIPFRAHCRFGFEVGGYGHLRGHYRSVVFLYRDPRPGLRETDRLDLGDAASEAAHNYRTEGRAVGPLAAAFEGDLDDELLRDTGTLLPPGKASRFRLAVLPGNDGVILRRRFDYLNGGSPHQTARVEVNGKTVGVWRTPGRYLGHLTAFPNLPPHRGQGQPNKRWREEDFELPGALTAGREHLDIRIVNVGTGPWNAYEYRALSRLTTLTADTTPPQTPTGLTWHPRGDDVVELTWAPGRDDVGVAGYEVWRLTPPQTFVQVGRARGLRFLDRHPPAGTHFYAVRAVDPTGNLSPFSAAAAARPGPRVRYEFEELLPVKPTPGTLAGRLDLVLFAGLGRLWSGDALLYYAGIRPGDGFGGQLTLPATGRYALRLHYTSFPGAGPFQVLLDGSPWGAPIRPPQNLGQQTVRLPARSLAAGPHTLGVQLLEPTAPFHTPQVLLDYLELEPQ